MEWIAGCVCDRRNEQSMWLGDGMRGPILNMEQVTGCTWNPHTPLLS